MTDLTERHQDAVGDVVRILDEAGVDVRKVNHQQRTESGVGFKLDVDVAISSPAVQGELEAVKEAAIEAPEFDMGGNPIEEGDADGE